jgi:hypothetical protein
MIVLDRSQDMTKLKGKGFMLQEKTVSSFDAFQRGGS